MAQGLISSRPSAATHLPAKSRIPAITALRHQCGPV